MNLLYKLMDNLEYQFPSIEINILKSRHAIYNFIEVNGRFVDLHKIKFTQE